MNRIRFDVYREKDEEDLFRVRVLIDGRSLAKLARAVELPFAKAEGAQSIAGDYSGLYASAVLPPHPHFLARPKSQLYVYDDRIQVLGCKCGEPGCWPLACRIIVSTEVVVWRDFLQPHRQPGSAAGEWRHEGLGPFEFSRTQYEEALARAAVRTAA